MKVRKILAVAAIAGLATLGATGTAFADDYVEPEVSGPIDLDTFEGPLTIEVDGQLVEIDVEYGQAEETVAAIRAGDLPATQSARSGAVVAPMAICVDTWKNAVAGPGTYWTSANGCSIWGSNGFKKGYEVSNRSDVNLCAQGKGFNSAGTQSWYGFGCASGGSNIGGSVSWGNVVANSQTRAQSMSLVTGAAYQWKG